MSQRIGIARAAAAVIGLGGLLAASAPGVVTSAVASPVTDISAQATKKEQRQEKAQERRQEQRQERAQERRQEQRQERRQEQRQELRREERREARPPARPGARVVINPRGGPRLNFRIRGGADRIRLGNRDVVIVRGPRTVTWRGRQRALVPIGAIAALTVAGAAYAANAYVPVDQPLCTGYTEGGCFFHWAEVPTPEGDLIPQCVAYCPR
jgi:Flp pilus assembly protein TadB